MSASDHTLCSRTSQNGKPKHILIQNSKNKSQAPLHEADPNPD